MSGNDQLTGQDYINRPISELVVHPDYEPEAMQMINGILVANTTQLVLMRDGFDKMIKEISNFSEALTRFCEAIEEESDG